MQYHSRNFSVLVIIILALFFTLIVVYYHVGIHVHYASIRQTACCNGHTLAHR